MLGLTRGHGADTDSPGVQLATACDQCMCVWQLLMVSRVMLLALSPLQSFDTHHHINFCHSLATPGARQRPLFHHV